MIKANQQELQQVFLSMIFNAQDAIYPNSGKITIEISEVNEMVCISFSDTGRGIDEKYLSKLFDPFFTTKGDHKGDRHPTGIGLGLSVTYGIIKNHHGTIEVKSRPEKGTTFIIKIPIDKISSKQTAKTHKKKT